jgi:DNA-binding transcriptional regulator YdaS (Cro superfamily)
MNDPLPSIFEQVCTAAGGSQKALAERLGVSQPTVHDWKRAGFPPDRCALIERALGFRCETLRPDVEFLRDGAGAVIGYVVPLAA